jgi:nucleotide-binding universal stress UspA family protein
MIKDILLFIDDGKSNPDRVDTAITLAKRHGANLTGAVLGSMKPFHAPDADHKAVARMSERMADKTLAHFNQASQQAGLDPDTLTIYGDSANSAEKLAHYARNYDLVILRQPNPARDNFERMQECAKKVLLLSGRPVYFMPYTGHKKTPVQRVLIAWDGTPSVSRTVHDAIPLLRQAKNVCILVVESKKQQDLKHEVLVESLVRHLQNHDIQACMRKVNPGSNSVTTVIQNQVTEHNADLLIMGGHGTPTLKQKIFGRVSGNLFVSMVVPVLMSH